ncbi:hypothetical protein [Luteimonas saliphila]|uniref:hypothetical protein n=1 Tax=Luteimonas saliphila TaxID=2804919 RepID=UPI00192D60C7|nr:hypothetical protein [Luteimonas saliphila]
MPIVFEQLAAVVTEGNVAGRSGFTGGGYGLGLEFGVAAGVTGYGGSAELFQEDDDVVPELPPMAAGSTGYRMQATGFVYEPGIADGGTGFRGAAFGIDMLGVAGGSVGYRGSAYELPPMVAYGFFTEPAPLMVAYGGILFQQIFDGIVLGETVRTRPTVRLREVLALLEVRRGVFEGEVTIADAIALGDDPNWLIYAVAADVVLLGTSIETQSLAIARALERLILSGQARNLPEAIAALVDGLVFNALVEAYHHGQAAETLLLSSHIESLYTAFARLLDRVFLSAPATGTHTATILVQERLLLGVDLSHAAELVALIRDSIGFSMTLSIDNGEYIAWVMNTQTKAMSRYTQYPFNSFGQLGGRYVGCASDGLHWLDADTDNGTPIDARIRLGLDALGSRRLKRIPEAFVGYTSDGTLLLWVVRADEESGEREAAIYRLSPRAAGSKRENRFKVGRGLRAVDFDFVIENVDGANFDLSSIEFRPLYLDRRTRG